MSGIIQLKSTPSGIASPSAGSVFMGVNDSGVFFTKDESGTVTVYPTEGGTFTGGTVSSLSATTLSSTTLNVDFTDNLQFKTDSDFESISLDPLLNTKFIGDYIGLENTSATLSGYTGTGYVGMGVGVLDLGNGFAQTEYVGSVNGFALDDNTASTFKIMGLQDLNVFGNGVSLQNIEQSVFSGSSGTTEFYNRTQIDLDNEQARMNIGLITSDTDDNLIGEFYLDFIGQNEFGSQAFFGKINSSDESIELILNENNTGFYIENDLSDNTASLFNILNNSGNSIFDVRNDGVFASTLNIDFTDNLQFKSNPSLDSVIIDPSFEAKLVGEFLGLEETGSISGYTATSYNGIFDGILDINDGFFEFPLLANVQTFTVTDGAVGSIVKYQGLIDQTSGGGGINLQDNDFVLFSGTSGSTSFGINREHNLDNEQSQMQIVSVISYPDVDETNILFNIQFNGPSEFGQGDMYIGKNVVSNIIDESIDFGLAGYTTGFEISNNLADNTASLFKVKDNTDTNIFDVRNDGVFLPNIPTSDPVNAGQLWLDGTTLKVSAGV